MKPELFIGVCCTLTDFTENKINIKKSLDNLANAFNHNCYVLIVIQSKNIPIINFTSEKYNIEIIHDINLNVSNARNICIEKALDYNIKYVLFHDASIYWTKNAANFINVNKGLTPKVNVKFSDRPMREDTIEDMHSKTGKINPIYHPFIWSYLFNKEDISELRFNINFGPGENTNFKSGEDVLFLFEFFKKNKNTQIIMPKDNIYVYHPPREDNYSKHLLYAKGQGQMFKILIKKYPSIQIYFDLFLFFGNGIYRLLLCKKNSTKILFKRIHGFFKR
ncbi:hypothetical protein AAEZ94_003225 [Providencia rettgeri]|nr:hypothetical protein [Providencia rettgeri]EKH6497959.1 hypothetical protein [Providencia rettgeri]